VAQVVEDLARKHKVLSSNSSPTKKKKKRIIRDYSKTKEYRLGTQEPVRWDTLLAENLRVADVPRWHSGVCDPSPWKAQSHLER
jgi:hypothetical protein